MVLVRDGWLIIAAGTVRGYAILGALGLVGLLATRAAALDPSKAITQYNRATWTTTQNLPQDSIQGIAQTSDGYIWVGTRAGLGRFNGREFKVFEPDTTPGLQGRSIQSLLGASDGGLWIGTDGKGVTRLKDGVFTTLGAAQGLHGLSGNGLYEDADGVLWVATWDGVFRFEGDHTTRFDTRAGLPHNSVFGITGDRRGMVWVATADGLAELSGSRVKAAQARIAGMPQCALVDHKGRLWVGTSAGVAIINGDRVRQLTTEDGLLASFITVLAEDRDGNVWIGSEGGLNRYSDGRIDGLSSRDGLPGNTVSALLEDREGHLWVGMRGTGLVRLSGGGLTTYTSREGLSEDDTKCVHESRDGTLWIGSGHGLSEYRDERFRTYTRRDGLLSESVTGIGEHSRYGLLVGTYAKKLNVVRDGKVSVFEPLTLDATVPSVIFEDRQGALWVGTLGVGLYRLHQGILDHYDGLDVAGQHVIHDVVEDEDGVLRFATANGILRYEQGQFSSIVVYRQGANLGVTYSLYRDATGDLWVGTRDRGVCRLRDDRTLRCYTRADGLFDDTVYHVTEDDAGRLWMSSPRGLFFVEREELDAVLVSASSRLLSRSFGVADGMKTAECQGTRWPSGARTTDGHLWFPTAKGVVEVDPQRLGERQPPPRVVIESVRVDGRVWDAPATLVAAGPGRGDVEITYAGLSYRSPETTVYRTMLAGYSDEWSAAVPRLRATYTNIPPGRYTFKVQASTDGTIWSETPAGLGIELEPHYYQTSAWRAGVALGTLLLVVAGMWGVLRWRLRRLKDHADELSRKVQEALANARILGGLLPICASCKRIRRDEGYWEAIEAYIRDHSEADFTHGICPECVHKLYPDLAHQVLSGKTTPPPPTDTDAAD